MNNPNGFTQKELLLEVIANQKKFDDKLSEIHQRINHYK